MTPGHWDDPGRRCFGFQLGRTDAREAALLVLINAGNEEIPFALPPATGTGWLLQLDSAHPDFDAGTAAGATIRVPAHGLLLLTATDLQA